MNEKGNEREKLYSVLGQLTDYLLPLFVLLIVWRADVSSLIKLFLAALVIIILLQSFNSYRVALGRNELYLNNGFLHRVIPIEAILSIERKPFFYSSSGGIGAYSYKLRYLKNGQPRSVIVVISKQQKFQQLWQNLKSRVARRA